MKRVSKFMVAVASGMIAFAVNAEDPAMDYANKMLKKLTLEEKIKFCHGSGTMTIGANPKIGLAEEFVMSDSSHTVRWDLARMSWHRAGSDYEATVMPALQGLAQTWDVELAKQFGNLIGQEARHRGKDMMLGPGVNIHRTPLCGRNWEYMSEDPFHCSRLTVPYIKSLQQNGVAATVKHFAVNNQEWNRNNVDTLVDERTLREIYFPAFEAAVVEGGTLALMSGFNRFRGEFCSHSDYLNNKVLKGEWGYKGLVVTDWDSLHNAKAGALGGTDVEMNNGSRIRYFKNELIKLVKSGEVPESVVDDKVRRVLYVMAKIGKIGTDKPRVKGERNTQKHQNLARKVAEDALVLLKNENDVLPLNKSELKRVLIVGNANAEHCYGGCSASGNPPYEVTPLEGITALLGKDVKVEHITFGGKEMGITQIPSDCILTENPNNKETFKVTGWKLEYFKNKKLEGTPVAGFARELALNFTGKLKLPKGIGKQNFSMRATAQVVPKISGKYILKAKADDGVRVKLNGKVVLNDWSDHGVRLKTSTITLKKNEAHTFVVEYYQGTGDGSLEFGWASPGGEDDAILVQKAKQADAVLIFTGTVHGGSQDAREEEMQDRSQYELPNRQLLRAKALLGINPKTVLINHSGSAVALDWAKESVPAIIQEPYNGQEAGNALANVLFGRVNPSAKLTYTIGKKLTDYGAHALDAYNPRSVEYKEGVFVGYRWFEKKEIKPVYPFGYGLSYTTFKVQNMKVSSGEFTPGKPLTVTVDVTNTGKVAGAEVVQLYVHDNESSVERPYRELKGFAKVMLQPGETKSVAMKLNDRAFSFWDEKTNGWLIEPGTFTLLVGSSSDNVQCNQVIKVK